MRQASITQTVDATALRGKGQPSFAKRGVLMNVARYASFFSSIAIVFNRFSECEYTVD